MANNINDALTGYDMVWAVTQDTLQSQLTWLFSMGFISNEVKFGNLDKDGLEFDAVIDQPDLIIANESSNAIAYFVVKFASGKIKYYTGFGRNAKLEETALTPDPNNIDQTTWKLAFKVQLNIALLAENYKDKKSIPPSIQDKLSNFKSSDFTVKNIFLDFQNSDMTSYDEGLSNIPTTSSFLKSNFSGMLGAWILDQQKTDNPYILGYTADAPSNDPSIFQPTGSTFSSHRFQPIAPENAGLSTLNFLLMTDGTTPSSQGGQFNYNLVESNEFSGTGLVAKEIVCSKWIETQVLPALKHAIGGDGNWQRQGEDAKWVYDFSPPDVKKTYENADSGMVDIHATYSSKTYAAAEIRPSITDSNGNIYPGIYISGYYYYRADFKEKPLGIETTAWQYDKLPWEVKLFMKAGTNGKIQLWSETTKGNKDSGHDESWLAKFADLFDGGYNDSLQSVDKSYTSLSNNSFDFLTSYLHNTLSQLEQQVILPAPSVFVYKDVSFTDEKDMKVHFSYNTQVSP